MKQYQSGFFFPHTLQKKNLIGSVCNLLSTAILIMRKRKKKEKKKEEKKTQTEKNPLKSLPNRAFTNAQKHATLALWGKNIVF